MSKQFVLYGLGGAETQYIALRYTIIPDDEFTVTEAIKEANWMRMRYPSVQTVYLIDNLPSLRREYLHSIKDHKNSIESRMIFRDILERMGIKLQ